MWETSIWLPWIRASRHDCLRRSARIAGGGSAVIWTVNPKTGGLAGPMLTDLPSEALALYAGHYYKSDPWMTRFALMDRNTVVRGSSLIDDSQLARSAYYNEFGSRFDTFHVIGAVLPLAADPALAFGAVAVLRPRNQGSFDDREISHLTRLLPHMRRSFQLSAQIGDAASAIRDAALDGMLEALGFAAVVLDSHGRVLRANRAAERLDIAGVGLSLRGRAPDQSVVAALPNETRRLREAVWDAAHGGPGRALRLTLRPDGALLAIVCPVPRRLATLPGLPRELALLIMRPLLGAAADEVNRVATRFFHFTAGEAAVASALAAGLSPKEIAEGRGVRVSTVRTLLQRAQHKADARDLRDLVRSLTALQAGAAIAAGNDDT